MSIIIVIIIVIIITIIIIIIISVIIIIISLPPNLLQPGSAAVPWTAFPPTDFPPSMAPNSGGDVQAVQQGQPQNVRVCRPNSVEHQILISCFTVG